jgi:hypothetical protein
MQELANYTNARKTQRGLRPQPNQKVEEMEPRKKRKTRKKRRAKILTLPFSMCPGFASAPCAALRPGVFASKELRNKRHRPLTTLVDGILRELLAGRSIQNLTQGRKDAEKRKAASLTQGAAFFLFELSFS